MTEPAKSGERRVDLFALMDQFAFQHLYEPSHSVEDNRFHFHRLIKLHGIAIDDAERSVLFSVWLESHLGQMRDQLATLRSDLAEQDQARRNVLFNGQPGGRAFLCRCGEMLEDAFDIETMRKHRAHVLAPPPRSSRG